MAHVGLLLSPLVLSMGPGLPDQSPSDFFGSCAMNPAPNQDGQPTGVAGPSNAGSSEPSGLNQRIEEGLSENFKEIKMIPADNQTLSSIREDVEETLGVENVADKFLVAQQLEHEKGEKKAHVSSTPATGSGIIAISEASGKAQDGKGGFSSSSSNETKDLAGSESEKPDNEG